MNYGEFEQRIKSVAEISDFFIVGYSLLSQPVYAAHVGSYEGRQVIVQAAIHAREYVTALLCAELTRYAAARPFGGGAYFIYNADPDGIRLVLDGADFIPCEKQRAFLTSVNGGTDFSLYKANANAVDLNVNFDADWGGGAQNRRCPSPESFIGYYPMSEREVNVLATFTRKISPYATLSYHKKASIESELKVAREIQMSMLPRIFPAFPNRSDIDLFAMMTPAKEVGGDLYDYFVQDERLYLCVGDVSGKGIPASLFMAVTRNLFRIVAQQGHTPAEIATQLNNILSHDNDQNMFVTMFIGCADLRTGHFDYCNCGHNIPLLDGKFMDVNNTNFPLGVMEGVSFVGESIDDIRDHQLLIYTDGLNEAENRQHELFGDDRLLDFISGKQDVAAEELIPMLHEVVESHRDGAIPNDDLTMLCLRVLKP